MHDLGELRRMASSDPAWTKLAEDVRFQLSSALAVDPDHAAALTAFGLLYLEGLDRTKSRLGIAKLALDEAAKRAPQDPSTQTALGIWAWHRGSTSLAIDRFANAAKTSAEAKLDLALAYVQLGKFADAKQLLAQKQLVPALAYEQTVALGIAHRGLGDHASADAAYRAAIALDARRPEAHFASGVLHAQIGERSKDLVASRAAYERAAADYRNAADRAATRPALKASAQAAATDADKIVAQIKAFEAKQP